MKKEQITDKEGICIAAIFIMGSSLILGISGAAKNDAWLSGILGIIMAIPMMLVYSRILSLYQGKDIYDILNIIFGRFAGKIASAIYIWYAFHLGALVIRNLGEFIKTVAMPETPIMVTMLYFTLCAVLAARSGVEVLGRISAYFLPVLIFILAIVQLLVIPQLHLNYIKPVLANGWGPVLKGGFSAFAFPFAESVLMMGVFYSLKTKKSPGKVYFWALFISGLTIILLTLRNISVLGQMLGSLYFPSYVAVSRISVGDFIQRIEVAVAIVFITCALIKTMACILVTSRGISRIFNLSDYRSIVIQTGLLMVYLAYIIYDNIMEMEYWAFNVYSYYALPFQVVVPVLILIAAEIRVRRNKTGTEQNNASTTN